MSTPSVTVWFDGACPLCAREIAFMRRLDRKQAVRFIDVSTDTSSCPIEPVLLLERFHAQENGELLSGAAAFAAMWRALPVLRPLGLIARNRLVLACLEKLYVAFLKYRPKFQRFATRLSQEKTGLHR
jgi:predicted DCC family thiol-disulfide oxidoreductase YuxK